MDSYDFDVKLLLQELNSSKNINDLTEKWVKFWPIFKNSRYMFSFDNVASNVPPLMSRTNFADKAFLRSIFKEGFLYFLDNDIIEGYAKNIDSKIHLDYSISFDTNFSSYINSYIRGRDLSGNTRAFEEALDFIVRNDVNYDYTFYMLENHENFKDKKKAQISIDNLRSLHKLMTLDLKHYNQYGGIKSRLSEDQIDKEVNKKIKYTYKSKSGKSGLAHYVKINNAIYCILLKTCYLQFFDKEARSKEQKSIKLIDFMHSTLFTIFERELLFGLYFINEQNKYAFFNKLRPNSKNLLNNIRNLSWDLTLLRILEYQASNTSKLKYYFPCFLTFDRALADLSDVHPAKSYFLDPEIGDYLLPNKDPFEIISKYLDEDKLYKYFNKEGTQYRRQNRNPIDKVLIENIKEIEFEISLEMQGRS